MKVALDSYGRVRIPSRLRQQLNLLPGDVLEATIVEDRLVLSSQHAVPALRYKGRVLVIEGEAIGNLETVVDDLRNER